MSQIGSSIDSNALPFAAQADFHRNEMRKLQHLEEIIKFGGGKNNIAKHHEKGKLTARERIALLIDADSHFEEIGLFAAYGLYENEGGAPSAGVIAGVG